MAMETKHDIVVLGGNFGGIQVIHYLFKNILPALVHIAPTTLFHVTLITPNSHFYFKIAAPRALVDQDLLPEEKYLRPLREAFSRYSGEDFTLLSGVATALDPVNRKVTIGGKNQSSEIHYDTLVIATGTTSTSALWTLHEDETLTHSAMIALQQSLPGAKTILIAGGGPVGVETAGEIACRYPSSSITLISGGNRVLAHAKAGLGNKAEAYLRSKCRVEVLHGIKVTGTSSATDGSGDTIVQFSDGTNRKASLYIDATGGKPNSNFIPGAWLDSTGRVKLRDAYFRVLGSGDKGSEDASRVYAVGDIVAGSPNTMLAMEAQVPCICSSIGLDISNDLQTLCNKNESQSIFGRIFGMLPWQSGGKILSQQEYKPMKDTIIVPIGKNGGVGSVMGFAVPSFFVKMAKGKSFLIEQVQPILTGTKW